MGSASRHAITSSKTALAGLGAKANLALGEQLFAAGRAFAESAQLRAVLADPAVSDADKSSLLGKVFGKGLDATASKLLGQIVSNRWSSQRERERTADQRQGCPTRKATQRSLPRLGEVLGPHPQLIGCR